MDFFKGFFEESKNRRNETEYLKMLDEARPSFDSWIRACESGLPVYDMSISENAPASFFSGDPEYVARVGAVSFRIVPMSKCMRGFSVRTYLEDIIVFCNGELTETALSMLAEFFNTHPKCRIAYGDEDISIREQSDAEYAGPHYGTRSDPYFKPDWSPAEFVSHFYFCNMVAVRRSFVRELEWTGDGSGALFIYHNLSKVIFSGEYFALNCVGHVEGVLIHAADYNNNLITDPFVRESAERLRKEWEPEDKISIVIYTDNSVPRLEKALDSVLSAAEASRITPDLIVIDNASPESSRRRTVDLQLKYGFKYEYLTDRLSLYEMFAKGIELAEQKTVLFMSDRITFPEATALREMYDTACLKFSGIVGIKQLLAGSDRILHAGVFGTALGLMYKLKGFSDANDYAVGFNRFTKNVLAVSFECVMFKRDLFGEIGGFDSSPSSSYAGADLCIRLFEAGYFNAVCNGCFVEYEAYDGEIPRTGGALLCQDASALEKLKFYGRHPVVKARDPFYNRYLLRDNSDPRILPACEYSFELSAETAEKVSVADFSFVKRGEGPDITIEYAGRLGDYLHNETSDDYYIQGYMVMRDINNAGYLKYILLRADKIEYYIPVKGCYRSDVTMNCPGAENTEFSGFAVVINKSLLPADTYQIGAMMHRKHFREKAVNYTDVYLVVNK